MTLPKAILLVALTWLLTACGGGGGGSGGDDGCAGSCVATDSFLSVADVEQVIAQAAQEATAEGRPATIAVVDRVGNVLGVFRMTDAATSVTISSGRTPSVSGGLEGIAVIPDTLAAIAKAVTGAYLSSEGNAFSTRVASQIVQEHFNPGEQGQPGGPLFGVQFSQLPCSDLARRFPEDAQLGPKRSPLGLSADPGGFPLYKNGAPVGGIGVMSDGLYSLDLDIGNVDRSNDEMIALAGTAGFSASSDRQADHIVVDGKTLRFSDAEFGDLASQPSLAPPFSTLAGQVLTVTGYSDGTLVRGAAFGEPESGVAPADQVAPDLFPGQDGYVLVDASGNNRYPPRSGELLNAAEVTGILRHGLDIANRARAQIRQPLGTPARVTISVVDTDGSVLGLVRSRDAPVFGTDVSLQKARTAAFFSSAGAADALAIAPNTVYLNPDATPSGVTINLFDTYVLAVRDFLGLPTALADGAFAFSDRAGGNMSRPFFPDGDTGSANGPFSKPFASWSPFTDGMQLDLVMNQIIAHVVFVLTDGASPDTPTTCTFPTTGTALDRIRSGIQIFPGSVPVYKGDVLVGGIGVSGDGVDQDDMVAFLGLYNAGQELGTINNAPTAIRADTIRVPSFGVNLRFVQCPQSPFLDSTDQDVCDGK